jgi:hypothetical protein
MAQTLGYGKDGWMRVRKQMIQEIIDHRSTYSKLLSGKKELQTIIENLDVEISDNSLDPPRLANRIGSANCLMARFLQTSMYAQLFSFL